MAQQTEAGFRRQLTWRDGFAISLLVPVSIFAALGPAIGALGTWGVVVLFAIACVAGMLQNYLYAELAGMFPDKAGGVAIYAHEGWRRYLSPLGAISAFGYWAGWSFGVAVMAIGFGSVVQAQFFPDATWTIPIGDVQFGLAHLLGIGAIILTSIINVFGIRFSALLAKILGYFAVALILIFVIGPFVVGAFSTDGLTWRIPEGIEGWHLAIVFLFLFAWSAYGTEVAAIFTPEYKNPVKDTPRALKLAAVVTLLGSTLAPIGIGGTLGDEAITANPGGIYAAAFAEIVGPASWLISILLAVSFLLVMNGATADSGRALYGIANIGMSVKQLDHLNERGEPARAVFVALVVNIALVVFVGNPLGIIFAANVGYVLAHLLAITAFLLLRKDRPDWPRIIRLRNVWIPIAVILAVYNAVLLVVGALSPQLAGYGGLPQQLIGVGTLLIGLVLLVFRRVVQDRASIKLREDTPALPEQEREAVAD